MTKPAPKLWIAAIAPYVPGRATTSEGRKAAKLSSNENPLGASPLAVDAYRDAASHLNIYPDGASTALRERIATLHDLDPARVICGTGSDELLHLAAGAFAGVGDEILFPRHAFAVYPIAARRVGATPVEAEDRDYTADVDALLAAVTPRTRVVFLANPNNPTGTYISRAEVARLHAGLPADCLLVVDQAYAEYLEAGEEDGGLDLARTAPNVMITRTFSKIYGLAGQRIGWGYGPAEVIDALNRIRAPFNVTTAGQLAAIAAIDDQAFVDRSRAHNRQWREWLANEVAALGNTGLRAVPSKGNFLLLLFEGPVSAEAANQALMAQGYIARWLAVQGLPQGLRVSIGTEEETRGVAAALRGIVGAA